MFLRPTMVRVERRAPIPQWVSCRVHRVKLRSQTRQWAHAERDFDQQMRQDPP